MPSTSAFVLGLIALAGRAFFPWRVVVRPVLTSPSVLCMSAATGGVLKLFNGVMRRVPAVRHTTVAVGLVGCSVIVIASLIPGDMQVRTGAPKLLEHFGAYLATAGLLAMGFARPNARGAIALGLLAFAGLGELAQDYIPGRSTTLADFVASGLGALLGVLAVYFMGWIGQAKALRLVTVVQPKDEAP